MEILSNNLATDPILVGAFSLSTLRARSAQCDFFPARVPVHISVLRPVSRTPSQRRATRRRAPVSLSFGAS